MKLMELMMNEHVLAEWTDDQGNTKVLGSCTAIYRHTANFFMRVKFEPGTRNIVICLSLIISVSSGTRARTDKEFLLVFLPQTFDRTCEFPLAFEPLCTKSLENSPLRSVIEQADLTKSNRLIRVCFSLNKKGVAIVTPSTQDTIKPHTAAACELLSGLESLSDQLNFNIYMSRSDYAIEDLKTTNQHLRDITSIPSFKIDDVTRIYGRHARWIEWNKIDYSRRRRQKPSGSLTVLRTSQVSTPPPVAERQQLPPYSSHVPPLPQPTIQVSRTPPYETNLTVITETPPRPPVLPTIASPASDYCISDINKSESFREDRDIEIGSDEEYFAIIDARLSSSSAGGHKISETLHSEVKAWFAGAMMVSDNPHTHKRLVSRINNLGVYANTLRAGRVNVTKIWCSAILFYDPEDSNVPELWSPKNEWLILDMVKLILWSNKHYCSLEMCYPYVRCEFIALGAAARAVALQQCDSSLAKYKSQRGYCVAAVVLEAGRLRVISGEEERPRQSSGGRSK